MNRLTERDDREARLPRWAQDLIRDLRDQYVVARNSMAETAEINNRLHEALSGQLALKPKTNTAMTLHGSGHLIPLGDNALIHFGDFFDVRVSITGQGDPHLSIEGKRGISFVPSRGHRAVIIPAPDVEWDL